MVRIHSVFESYWLSDNTYKQTYPDTETGSYSSFPGHVGGARKWPENEATSSKVGELVASFPGHVGSGLRTRLQPWNCQ